MPDNNSHDPVMADDYGFAKFETNDFPIAYLLTFRTYGTWHHGDPRYSVGRRETNLYTGPRIEPSVPFVESMKKQQKQPAFILDEAQRRCVAAAIEEVCSIRNYRLRAQNIRSNHGHAVVSAEVKPEKIVNDFKAYGTRALRNALTVPQDRRIWSRGASTRYLWKPKQVVAAIEYVLYCQGDIPFDVWELDAEK